MMDFVKDCIKRLVAAGVEPYEAYVICRDFVRKHDEEGLTTYVALLEVLNYDDRRQFVD